MHMKMLEQILLRYLLDSKIKMEITGFDMDGFEKAVHEEGERRLGMIEYIAFTDDDIISDTEKIESIKQLFRRGFYSEG